MYPHNAMGVADRLILHLQNSLLFSSPPSADIEVLPELDLMPVSQKSAAAMEEGNRT
jgi:hypothetical protein